jgi:hypothetical protein
MRGALCPAPQKRGGADQRDYARKNAGKAHEILLSTGAHRPTPFVSAFSSNVHHG